MSESVLFKESQKFNTMKNVRCTWGLILLHVAEKTAEDSEFTFTSVDIKEAFGCSREAASHLIRRSVGHGTYIKIDTYGYRPFMYKISKYGLYRAKKMIESMGEIDNGR